MAEDVDVKYQPLLDDEENDADSYAFKPERRRNGRGWLIALIVVLVIVLIGAGLYYWQQSKKVPVTYTTAAVTVGNLSTTISATGPISAHAVYALNFSNAGQVSEIDVKIGQHVTQGQVLAKLYINGNTSRVAELTAPEAATVASINGVVGENSGSSGGGGSSSSASSSSAFMTLIDISSLNITAQVNESDIANVKVGQPAQFTVASYPSATFRASVASIELVGQTSSSVVTFPVHLDVDQNSLSGNNLYPGMTATVNITTAQRIGALLVPASAISFTSTALQAGEVNRTAITALTGGAAATGTGTGSTSTATSTTGSSRVVLTLNNGKLTPVLIKTGLNSGQYVEVLSGLPQGSEVVVSQTGGATSTTTTTTRTGGAGGFGGGAGGFGGGGGGFGGGGAGGGRGTGAGG